MNPHWEDAFYGIKQCCCPRNIGESFKVSAPWPDYPRKCQIPAFGIQIPNCIIRGHCTISGSDLTAKQYITVPSKIYFTLVGTEKRKGTVGRCIHSEGGKRSGRRRKRVILVIRGSIQCRALHPVQGLDGGNRMMKPDIFITKRTQTIFNILYNNITSGRITVNIQQNICESKETITNM